MLKRLLFVALLASMVMMLGCPGQPCGPGKIYDCSGNCLDEPEADNAVGNSICDAAFNCAEFDYDSGDCGATTTTIDGDSTTTITTTTTIPPGGTCVNVAEGIWSFCIIHDEVYPGFCGLEFVDGTLTQEGCFLSYDYATFEGRLTGRHWEVENPLGLFEFSGYFLGPPYDQFEGILSLTDGSGDSWPMTGQYDQ